jgi:hypothetical protein
MGMEIEMMMTRTRAKAGGGDLTTRNGLAKTKTRMKMEVAASGVIGTADRTIAAVRKMAIDFVDEIRGTEENSETRMVTGRRRTQQRAAESARTGVGIADMEAGLMQMAMAMVRARTRKAWSVTGAPVVMEGNDCKQEAFLHRNALGRSSVNMALRGVWPGIGHHKGRQ